jgi:murein DD-endopeptidase MepM/ murein hydrolase activator NlpD
MREKRVSVVLLMLLAGCIPRGADDYRIGSTPDIPAEPANTIEPMIVPERAVIADTPSWSPAVVERNAQQVSAGNYVVKAGDSLYGIEAKTGAGFGQIVSANDLPYPYVLKVGQKLIVPAGLYHRVSRGETGIAIARAYGASWADIVALNNLQHPYILREGQRLRLPDGAAVEPVSVDITPEQRAAAFSLNIDDIVTGGEPAVAGVAVLPQTIAGSTAFAGKFGWPVNGTLLSRYGAQGAGKVNDGINVAAAFGSPVRSAADGIVVYSGNEIGVFGGLVLIDHGGGWVTAYGHLGQLNVARGDKVAAAQTIGSVGDTGYVTQPQLHFEIRKDRKPVDPLTKLPAR